MDLYRKMYATLCAAASSAIDALPDTPDCRFPRILLEQGLVSAENLYIEAEDGGGQGTDKNFP